VRYRVHRIREALEDLKAARELSEALGDDLLRADMLLEEATALDFADDFEGSFARVNEARPLVEKLDDAKLNHRLKAALGRSHFRHGQIAEAVELLGMAADGAKSVGDYETQVISLLLLSPLLAPIGRLDEAESRFEEVFALCAAAEDWLHLGAAYANRAFLWQTRRLLDRCMDDLRRAIQLAREVGNPWSESIATYNVAEFLHWLGEEEEALVLANRVRVLEQRFADRPIPDASLLLARVQAARGEMDEARRLLNWVASNCPPAAHPVMEAFFSMLRLVLDDAGEEHPDPAEAADPWAEIISKASMGSFMEELLEALYWRAKVAIRTERWDEAESALKEAQQRLDECPMWRLRFADLISRSLLRQPTSIPAADSRTLA
jgi:tetratricopeptide (TPR) repeat protein